MKQSANPGTVYLVGAGPGDPDLITVRGLRLLQQADVVAYDRLVHPDLVARARPSARQVYVGKAPDEPSCSQEEINALLVEEGQKGRLVVRLKGGDPFVFGRGGEEALALQEAGVPFEVVPGISSAISAPAYAGTPVTHRGLSSSFTVVTGHTCRPESNDLDWAALAEAGTLVVLMGLKRLPDITSALLKHGRAPDTLAAVIQSASTADQKVVRGSLETISDRAAKLDPPATIVIGEVARLGPQLSWFTPTTASKPTSNSSRHPANALSRPALRFAAAAST